MSRTNSPRREKFHARQRGAPQCPPLFVPRILFHLLLSILPVRTLRILPDCILFFMPVILLCVFLFSAVLLLFHNDAFSF